MAYQSQHVLQFVNQEMHELHRQLEDAEVVNPFRFPSLRQGQSAIGDIYKCL